jgi:glyoxylase-like metal-dependent hydrolase (beta-lactamase superfamily II)
VRLHVVAAPEGFEARQIVQSRFWKEIALWFPQERVLVCADAMGSLGYFRAKNEPFGVHPLLRLFPPKHALAGLEPEHILFGHGPGYHGSDAPERLREALATSRRRLPKALLPG